MLPYFYKKGYHICIFEAKDPTLSLSLGKKTNLDRLAPGAYNMTIPIVSHIPSYLVNKNLDIADQLEPELVRKFNKKMTLSAKNIVNSHEWQSLIGAGNVGADVIDAANKQYSGNVGKMLDQIRRGRVKDGDGKVIFIHPAAKNSILIKLNKFKTDEVFNAPKCV